MNKYCNEWSRSCIGCQNSKVTRRTKSPIGTFILPSKRFEYVHMDIMGPLPPSQGYTYILTIIDRFSRWPEAYPIRNISAITVAKRFVTEFVPRFGVPVEITTGHGTQFESKLFQEITKLLGAHRIRTTAYHPQANGMVERFHRHLKSAIMARDNTTHWSEELPFVLLGIRTATKSDIGCSPTELVYGQNLRLPNSLAIPSDTNISQSEFLNRLRSYFANLKAPQTRQPPAHQVYMPKSFENAEHVFVRVDHIRKPFEHPYTGPYPVVKRLRKHFVVSMDGTNKSISVDRLKPASMP